MFSIIKNKVLNKGKPNLTYMITRTLSQVSKQSQPNNMESNKTKQ